MKKKEKEKKILKICESCGRDVKTYKTNIFPLCQDCDNESEKNIWYRRKEDKNNDERREEEIKDKYNDYGEEDIGLDPFRYKMQ
jgi:hypothetical protein